MSILFLSANVFVWIVVEGSAMIDPPPHPLKPNASPQGHTWAVSSQMGAKCSPLCMHTHTCMCGPSMQAMEPKGWASSHMCRLPPHNCHGHVGVLPMWPWGHIVGSLVAKILGVCGYQKPAPLHYLHGVPTIIIFTRFLGTRFFDQIQPVHHTYLRSKRLK